MSSFLVVIPDWFQQRCSRSVIESGRKMLENLDQHPCVGNFHEAYQLGSVTVVASDHLPTVDFQQNDDFPLALIYQ